MSTDGAASLPSDATAPPSSPSTPDFSATLSLPPILYRDIFTSLLLPLLSATPNRTDWDNLSSAHTYTDKSRTSSYAHNSPDTCRAACDIRAKCVQYVHMPGSCRLGTAVRIGGPVQEGKKAVSGWVSHRARKLVGNGGMECRAEEAFAWPLGEEKKSEEAPPPPPPPVMVEEERKEESA